MPATLTYMMHRWNDDVVAHTACFHCGAPTTAVIPIDEIGEAIRHDFSVECEACSLESGTFYTGVRLQVVNEDGTIPMNPGIVRLVAWLNEAGFKTTDSGDGATHDFECDRDEPYVVIAAPEGEATADTLHQLLEELLGKIPPEVRIQYNYSPLDGFRFIDLAGLCDAMIWKDDDTP